MSRNQFRESKMFDINLQNVIIHCEQLQRAVDRNSLNGPIFSNLDILIHKDLNRPGQNIVSSLIGAAHQDYCLSGESLKNISAVKQLSCPDSKSNLLQDSNKNGLVLYIYGPNILTSNMTLVYLASLNLDQSINVQSIFLKDSPHVVGIIDSLLNCDANHCFVII